MSAVIGRGGIGISARGLKLVYAGFGYGVQEEELYNRVLAIYTISRKCSDSEKFREMRPGGRLQDLAVFSYCSLIAKIR